MMYKISANNKYSFDVELNKGDITVNGNLAGADIYKIDADNFHILLGKKSFTANIAEIDRAGKCCVIKVNGNRYRLNMKDRFDELLHQLGMDNLAVNKINEVKAPMPGLVLKILVKEGDIVEKGDNLFVLEAMKMENIIKSPADAVVKAVKAGQGEKVEKNQPVILFS